MRSLPSFILPPLAFVLLFGSGCNESGLGSKFKFSSSSYFLLERNTPILKLSPEQQDDFSKYVLAQHAGRINSEEFKARVVRSLSGAEKQKVLELSKPADSSKTEKTLSIDDLVIIQASITMTPGEIPKVTVTAFSDHNPSICNIVVNKILEVYPQYLRDSTNKVESSVLSKLRDQLDDMSKEEKLLEQELEEFRRKHNIVSFETEREFLVKSLGEIKREISKLKLQKLEIQTVLLQIFHTKQEGKSLLYIHEVANFRNVTEYWNRIIESKLEITALEPTTDEKDPKIVSIRKVIAELERLLALEMESAIRIQEQQLVTFNQIQKELHKELAVYHSKVQQLDLLEIDYRVIEREVEAKISLRDAMLKRITDIETLNEMDDNNSLRPGPMATSNSMSTTGLGSKYLKR